MNVRVFAVLLLRRTMYGYNQRIFSYFSSAAASISFVLCTVSLV